MAVDQVSARLVQSLNSAGTQDANVLREGTQLEGRVLAVNADDSLRLATRYGLIDVDQSQVSLAGGGHGRGKLPPPAELIGTTVKLDITGQNSATGRYAVKPISPGDTAAASTAEQTANTPEAEIAARIAADIARAAGRQDGLAQVFASARDLSATQSPLPEDVSRALADLTSLGLNGAVPISADDVQTAVFSSGLFLEAKLARLALGAGSGRLALNSGASLGSQDLKAALFGLKAALDGWVSEETAQATQDAAAVGSEDPSTSGAKPAIQLAAENAASALEAAPAFDTEALFAVLRPPPTVTATATVPQQGALFAQAGASAVAQGVAATTRPDPITMAALGEWFQSAGQAQMGGGARRSVYGGRPIALDGPQRPPPASEIVVSTRPPPPRRGSLPQGQAAILPTSSPGRQPLDIARELALKASNALARVSLGQYASLPDHLTTGSHASTTPSTGGQTAISPKAPASWLFEIPISIGASTSIAQFEIDQVLDGGSNPDEGHAWRVQFSLDVAPLGPVHARLVLADRRLSVGLWAEDRIGAAVLQRSIPALRQSLEVAQFVVDEIHFAPGHPPSGPPARAGGFIDRNA